MSVVSASIAPHFWAAVEDCLVKFHQLPRGQAAEKVTSLWQRLPTETDGDAAFSEMIYHADPWQLACNLAEQELPVSQSQQAYQAILVRNGLLTPVSEQQDSPGMEGGQFFVERRPEGDYTVPRSESQGGSVLPTQAEAIERAPLVERVRYTPGRKELPHKRTNS